MAAILDIKEDIRNEAAKYGTVTNTVLYDLEEAGIVTVRFTEPESATRCAAAFDGRNFGGQKIVAYVPEHKEVFAKSSNTGSDGDALHDIDEDEKEDKEDKAQTLDPDGSEPSGNGVDGSSQGPASKSEQTD